MPKTKSVWTFFIILMLILAGVYVYAFITKAPLIGGVLSPMIAAISGFALLYAFIRSDREVKTNGALLLFAVGCFLWMLSDILWVAQFNQGRDPSQNALISLGYFLANIAIAAGAIYIGYCRYSKWKLIRSVIDALTIGILVVIFIWIVIFDKNKTAVYLLTREGIFSAVLIFLDLFMIIELVMLFIPGVMRNIPLYIRLMRTGIFLLFATSFIYYYFIYHNIYYSGSAADVLYVFSLVLIAFGALWKTQVNGSFLAQVNDTNTEKSGWLYFLAFPIIAMVTAGVYFIDLFIFAGIIVLYHAAVKYIQLASENERLLLNEVAINQGLESRINDQIKALTVLANEDTLTKLYNRRYFSVILEESITSLQGNATLSVIQFDIDRFKTINDSYGHDVGDKVIIALSNKLMQWNDSGAVLARLGGDEFVVLLRGSVSRHRLSEYCKQIIEICSAPIYIDKQVLYLTISIGIASCPKDARDSVSLMKNSDIAMYRAKTEGYNKYVFFTSSFKENISRKNEIEALLRSADLQTDFELVYQPQFTLPDKKLIGAEALIRWKSVEHGYIPPSVFVPIAEEINYINRIGKWVLFKAVEQIIKWNTAYGLQLKMGINISPKQLSEDDFFLTLKTLMTTSQFDPSWIDAEITENLMIEEKSKVKPIFDLFKELEISVSIDDFGSGYSSLGYLNKYHFDRIKIDKSLIDNLAVPGGSGVEVVKAIITMSNAVGKAIIAEGVETNEQFEILSTLGCNQVQGYLLGRPVSPEEFVKRFIIKK